jgi:RNA polymerase sigma factor (sigma-70 family)
MDLLPIPPSPELDRNYEALVKSHRAAFERLARRLARDPEDAEDLLQETLVDAYRAFGKFRADSHFYSWVARIMTNNHLDRVRRKQHRIVSLDQAETDEAAETLDLPDETSNPERVLLRDELDHRFHSALEALQPPQRATVILCDLDGATYEEAARVEECPIGTIRSRLHRAHKALRDFLASLDAPAPPPRPVSRARAHSRRAFLFGTMAAAGAALTQLGGAEEAGASETIRVLVWSEGSAPKEVYPNDVSGAIADGLRTDKRFDVRTASLKDPDQGLGDEALENADVLVWWGCQRHAEVRDDRVAAVARRVRDGRLGFIATHAAHGSRPLQALLGTDCVWKGGSVNDGAPMDLRVTAPRHPIAAGIESFRIEKTERYEGAFDVPKPDVLVFDGTYSASERSAWQGMVWTVDKGRIFYFQPGHEEYPIYFQEEVRQVFRNAVHWCANR